MTIGTFRVHANEVHNDRVDQVMVSSAHLPSLSERLSSSSAAGATDT
jgi:hypothetical protein